MPMNSILRKHRFAFLFLLPHLAGVIVFYLLPFLWGVVQSFHVNSGVGIGHYVNLLGNEAFRLAARNTLFLTLLTVPLLIIVSLAAALYVQSFVKSGSFLLHSIVFNYAIPTASIAYIWLLMFGNYGFVNTLFVDGLGLSRQNWLDGTLLYIPIISFFLVKYAAYPVLILIGGLQALPRSMYEAAEIDGASKYARFKYITLPLLVPEILFSAMLGFFFNFKIYKEAYAMFGAYPPKSIYLVQHFMNNHFIKLNMGTLTSSATIMTMIIAIIIYLLIRFNRSAYIKS